MMGCSRRAAPPLASLAILVVLVLCAAATAQAQDFSQLLQYGDDAYYMLTVSGTVNDERFSGVNAILHLGLPEHLSTNPYTLTIVGYPRQNVRNVFFWDGNEQPMQVFGSEVVMRTSGRGVGELTGNHFFYLSPVLLEVPQTHQEQELRIQAERDALPTKIFAIFGEVSITFIGTRLHGTVHMNGRDPIGNEFVQYRATFSGEKTMERPPLE